jgi:hypothetical protein
VPARSTARDFPAPIYLSGEAATAGDDTYKLVGGKLVREKGGKIR